MFSLKHINPLVFVGIVMMTFQLNNSFGQTYKVEEVTYDFSLIEIPQVNSKFDDFSPVWFNNELIFTSGRESNLVLLGENNWGKTGFLNVFKAPFKESDSAEVKTGLVELYSKQLSNNNHTGPVAFTTSGDTIFYTQLTERVKRQKEIRYPQLYMAVKVDDKWENVQALPFNNKEYSFGHPSWDSKHQKLYFSSNMPNGKGGKDIYSASFKNGKWGKPENLELNSEQDDMFPFIIGNDLFFSSNRDGGKGNLDIYWKQLGTSVPLENIDDLNTPEDDHGIFILPDYKKGFVSIRQDNDDNIYMLNVERKVTVTNELAGKFTYRNMGTDASGLNLKLIHDDDVVFEIDSDENGEFAFKDLPHENYTIKTMSEDNLELVLYDKDGNPTTYLIQDGEGKFQYKKVDPEDAGTLTFLEDMNEKWLDFTDITGQFVYETIAGEYGDSLKVMLVDEDGNIVFTEFSDDRGNFTFINVPTDQNYTITTENQEDDLFLVIYDQNGNVYTQLKQNEEAEFIYKKIDPEYADNLKMLADGDDVFEHNTTSVTGNFNYKKGEGYFGKGLTIYLYDEDEELLDSTVTNEKGEFNFRGLNPDKAYLFKMNEDELGMILDEFNLHIEDRYGNVLMDLYRAEDGFYKFKNFDTENGNPLDVADIEDEPEFVLNNDPVEDPEEDPVVDPVVEDPIEDPIVQDPVEDPVVEDPIVENIFEPVTGDGFNIYFDRNSSYADFESNNELQSLLVQMKQNPKIKINISAFASCRSDDHYNMWISERRGNRVKDYLISNGIDGSRINVLAFGESKLVNDCGDGVDCPDEEHAKNRRVEIILAGS